MKDKKWLVDNGYDGLYVAGECSCENKDLAPCGDGPHEDCEPGYTHLDPRPGHKEFGDFAISGSKEDLTSKEWSEISYC